MTDLNLTQLVKKTELRTINFLTKLIPIKVNDENPYNGVEHSDKDVEFIMDNLTFFNEYNSKQLKESLSYFQSKI